MNNAIRTLGFLALLGFATIAPAQVIFTVTATANSTTENYTSGNSYTFIFTMGNFTTLGNSGFSASNQFYQEVNTSDDQLWSSLAGSGLLGSFIRPTGNASDPYSWAKASIPPSTPLGNSITLTAATDRISTQHIGVTTLQGTALSRVEVFVDNGGLPSFSTGAAVSPAAFFSSYTGTYTGFSGGNDLVELYSTSNTVLVSFTPTSLTISAVPEPSAYATLAGLGALGLALIRRRLGA